MYVADSGSGNVSRIDTNTMDLIGSPIRVGDGPYKLAYDPDNHEVYVVNCGNLLCSPARGSVSVIPTTGPHANSVVKTISVGYVPYDIAYDPINHRMYVTNRDSPHNQYGSVSVIDPTSNTVIADRMTGSSNATDIAYDPVHHRMYITHNHDNVYLNGTNAGDVTIIDTNAFNTPPIGPIQVGPDPWGLTSDMNTTAPTLPPHPHPHMMYVTSELSPYVYVIDVDKVNSIMKR
jgi:DNA-binding beta-propeller fold protein YncE